MCTHGWRPDSRGRPTNPGNITVTASHPWPVLASVAQALLPVRYAWNASAMAHAGVPVLPLRCPCLLSPGWNLLCAVDDSKDVDLIRLEVIDDSKRTFQNLPNLWDSEFRDFAP